MQLPRVSGCCTHSAAKKAGLYGSLERLAGTGAEMAARSAAPERKWI